MIHTEKFNLEKNANMGETTTVSIVLFFPVLCMLIGRRGEEGEGVGWQGKNVKRSIVAL